MRKLYIILIYDIQLERKCTREDQSVGTNVENRVSHRLQNVTAYVWVHSGTFSLQWDIIWAILNLRVFRIKNFCIKLSN